MRIMGTPVDVSCIHVVAHAQAPNITDLDVPVADAGHRLPCFPLPAQFPAFGAYPRISIRQFHPYGWFRTC